MTNLQKLIPQPLPCFLQVSNNQSFTKAAEAMSMTQPAVTFQIAQLEDVLETKLFDRLHNKIKLTDDGTTLYNYASVAYEKAVEIQNQFIQQHGHQVAHQFDELRPIAKQKAKQHIKNTFDETTLQEHASLNGLSFDRHGNPIPPLQKTA